MRQTNFLLPMSFLTKRRSFVGIFQVVVYFFRSAATVLSMISYLHCRMVGAVQINFFLKKRGLWTYSLINENFDLHRQV
jgi:hypothetical protein